MNYYNIISKERILGCVLLSLLLFTVGCKSDDDNGPSSEDYVNVLTNQVDNVVIPTMKNYAEKMDVLKAAATSFTANTNASTLAALRSAYREANLAYQAAAVHNYYTTENVALVETSNLFPIDVTLLGNLIENESYNFNTTAQMRANGFPALDYMLYGLANSVAFFDADPKRKAFLNALVDAMTSKANNLSSSWSGNLRNNFIENGGVDLGSSISVQLNQSTVYYEEHVRENKVGIPIGRLGPNDSPIAPDATKREAYYQSISNGDDAFSLELVKAAVQSLQRLYDGTSPSGADGQGYDDLVIKRDKASVDTDITAQFNKIFAAIDARTSIAGDETLYNEIQAMVTLLKTDLFTLLNVQDADGMVDGD